MPVPLSVYCSTKLYPKHIQYTDIYSSSVPNAKRNLFTELVLSHCPCTLLSTECQTSVGEHSPGQQKALPARRDYTYCLLATGSACSREQGTASVHAQLSVHPCSSGSEHQHIVKSCGFFFLFFFSTQSYSKQCVCGEGGGGFLRLDELQALGHHMEQ